MYGVVRASTRAPIQSGPLRFARCLGRKGTWSLGPSGARAPGWSWPTAPAQWPLARRARPAGHGKAPARPITRCRRASRGQLANIRARARPASHYRAARGARCPPPGTAVPRRPISIQMSVGRYIMIYTYIYVWHPWAMCRCPWGCACVWVHIQIYRDMEIYIYIVVVVVVVVGVVVVVFIPIQLPSPRGCYARGGRLLRANVLP